MNALVAGHDETSLHWLEPDADPRALVAQRVAIYGGELGWLGDANHAAWDDYDLHSSALLAFRSGVLVASSRLTLEQRGALEVSDLVDWKRRLEPSLRNAPAAEWSRVMIDRRFRHAGLFGAMYASVARAARASGARLLAGASVPELRPLYQSLGFVYLDLPFSSPHFQRSPLYYPAYQVLA